MEKFGSYPGEEEIKKDGERIEIGRIAGNLQIDIDKALRESGKTEVIELKCEKQLIVPVMEQLKKVYNEESGYMLLSSVSYEQLNDPNRSLAVAHIFVEKIKLAKPEQ